MENHVKHYVDALLDQLQAQGARTVLRYHGADISGHTLRDMIYRYARALDAADVARGCFVALFAPNSPDALAVRYAANLLGAATMFLPAPADAERRRALLACIQPTHLVAFAQTVHLVPDASNDAPKPRLVRVGCGPLSWRLDVVANTQSAQPLACRARPGDLAVIVSSGGTTGVPKGSRRSFAAYSALVAGPRDVTRRQLVNGALAYLSQVLVDVTLIGGGTVVLDSHVDAARTLASIENERITDLFLVEPQLFAMMDHADVTHRDLSSLRSVTHIGGSAPAILRRRAMARLGPVLTHVYGASEAGLISVLAPDECIAMPGLLASAGRVRAGVQWRLRRADGRLAQGGECGRIEVKSASVAQGYRNMPDEDALKFRDGWCMTGDVGFIDRDGYVQIIGRAADVAEIDARTIGPAQIEDVLCRLPDVRYAVAFTTSGTPGWLVALEAWRGERVDIARCGLALKASLGAGVAEKVRLAVIDRAPLTEQGKVDRAAVERMVKERGKVAKVCA